MNTTKIHFLLKRNSQSIFNGFNSLSELGYVCSWLESLCDWYGDSDKLGCNKKLYDGVEDYWNYSDGFYSLPIAIALVLALENSHHSTAKQAEAFSIFSSGILLILMSYYAKPRNNSRGLNDVFSDLIKPGIDASDIGFAVGSFLDLAFAAYKYHLARKLETFVGWREEKRKEVNAYKQQLEDFKDLSNDEEYKELQGKYDKLEADIKDDSRARALFQQSKEALSKSTDEAFANMISKAVAFAGWTTLALSHTMGGWVFIVPLSFYYVYKNVPIILNTISSPANKHSKPGLFNSDSKPKQLMSPPGLSFDPRMVN